MQQPIYVIDTNILVDYPDIIPAAGKEFNKPKEPTVDLSRAHLVLPTAVIRELSSFKREKSERGRASREVLRNVRDYVENLEQTMDMAYEMESAVSIVQGEMQLSILPVHKNFCKTLPFHPSADDMDGQIILATLSVACLLKGLPIDGTANPSEVMSLNVQAMNVTLLTNDNGLAIRACERGINTSRYGYRAMEPYTGRRDIIVPPDLFKYFYDERKIEREIWEMMMPEGQDWKLVANEFVIMHLADPMEYPLGFRPEANPYFLHIARYDPKTEMLLPLRYVREFPSRVYNDGQAIYAEALMNPDIAAVICTGPAGSGKTYMATVFGYSACKKGTFIGVTVVPCESRSRIGALPGDLNEKMDPDVQPLKNALRNYLLSTDRSLHKELEELRAHGAKEPVVPQMPSATGGGENGGEVQRSLKEKLIQRVNLIWNSWFSNLPIESARGRDFSYELALYDVFQDQNQTQADTLLKRLGMNGKIVLTGDLEQIHAPYLDESNNGLTYASQLLFDNPMVAQVHFTEDEVVRHPLVKMVAERQKNQRSAKTFLDDEMAPDIAMH